MKMKMKMYKVLCLKDGKAIYNKIKFLTEEELASQLDFWNVSNFSELLQRWNQQIESSITKLQWIYYEI